MTNEEIVEEIQSGINVRENLGMLYEQNQGFIYMVVKPFMQYAEPDDLLQEAYFGLYDAVYSYIPGETKFTTYLPYQIRKKCLQFMQSFSNTKRIPASRMNEIRKYQRFCQEFHSKHQSEPDDKTIMDALELTEKKLYNIRKTILEQNCISIHKAVAGTEDAALEDILVSDTDIESEVTDGMFQAEIKKIVDDAVEQLPSKQSQVIQGKYLEEKTQLQIASEMNISNSRVGQIEKDALNNLKQMDKLQELHDEIYGYDSQYAYGMTLRYALNNHTSCTEKLVLKRITFEEKQKKLSEELDTMMQEMMEG